MFVHTGQLQSAVLALAAKSGGNLVVPLTFYWRQ